MRTLNRLSAMQVSRAKRPGVFSDGGGLYLQVSPTLAKSWLFRYMRGGRARGMGLGPLHTISLAEARDKALDCRKQLLNGVDPLDERRSRRKAAQQALATSLPFRECASKYIESHRSSWKNKRSASQWENSLATYAFPVMGDMLVADIDTDEVMRVLEPIWLTKTETASRLRGRIEAVLAWASVRRYRSEMNPARWKGHLDQLFPDPSKVQKTVHHAALPYGDAPAFMAALLTKKKLNAAALRLAILTASRTNEVIGAKRSEFDLTGGLWTIPSERMKAGREHRVPLSSDAVALVKALLDASSNEIVFPGKKDKPLSNMAMLVHLKRMGRDDLTVHGFRSTFKDWARETTHYPNEVSEAALAHVIGDQTEAAYARGDLFNKRVGLMQDWADYVAGRKAA